MKKHSKNVGVSRPKKVGSVSASKSSAKKRPDFPAIPSRALAQKPPTVMNIYAKPGTKVTPIYKDGKPLNGYTFHQEQVAKHLPEGGVFTVESTDVGNYHTDVYLVEVPGVSFNSVCLADAPSALGMRKDRPKATPKSQ